MSIDPDDPEFQQRQQALKARVNRLDRETLANDPGRGAFFETVYDQAEGDPAGIPWADLRPKDRLIDWLAANPGKGRSAIDVACGLGDNAEAISDAGYTTAAFDGSAKAIDWARQRFPRSRVDYQVANLLKLPQTWRGRFDLVDECYTIQSVPPPLHEAMTRAIASLVRPGGTLLVYTRVRPEGSPADGPPWPLTPMETGLLEVLGFREHAGERFDLVRIDGSLSPHLFAVWRRIAGA